MYQLLSELSQWVDQLWAALGFAVYWQNRHVRLALTGLAILVAAYVLHGLFDTKRRAGR